MEQAGTSFRTFLSISAIKWAKKPVDWVEVTVNIGLNGTSYWGVTCGIVW
jgi:hypothetical protein